MPEPSSEHEHDHPQSHEGDRHSRDESGSHQGQRRRHRHRRKREKPTSKAAVVAGIALILIAAAVFFVVGPRVVRKFKAMMRKEQQTVGSGSVVHLTYRSVIVTNSSGNDWGYTTVTVNDQYEAHCPDIPKGTQFEISLRDFRGPTGRFEPTAPTVKRVTVQVEGQKPITWDRPME